MTGWAPLLGALGLVAIVFGLLSFLLAIFGAPTDAAWIYTNFTIGVLLLGSAVALNLDAVRERLSSGEARRASKYGGTALLSAALAIAILGGLGWLAARYPIRVDWTEAKLHSLSDQTHKVLDALERDVEVLVLASSAEETAVRDLLDRYAYESDRFRIEFANPTERPDLVERHGITPDKLNRALVRVGLGDDSVEVSEITEEAITNALVKLTRTGEKKVYFLEGHNEHPVEGDGSDGAKGLSRALDALQNETYRVETLLLAAKGSVPDDADVVVLAGPTRPLLPVEHAALTRYLEAGGAVLVLIDPRARTDLYEDLESWGVNVGEDVIVDRQLALFGRATTPFAGNYDGAHSITKDLRETTLFHMARSVRSRDGADGDFTEIVFTGKESWAERDLELFFRTGRAELGDDDLRGPVPLAIAGTPALAGKAEDGNGDDAGAETESEARLVVIGDSDFATNEFLEAYRNRDLFVNSVNWLLGDVEAISIRPARSRASRFQLSSEQFSTIRVLSLFLLPEAIAVLGVLTWWARRQAPRR